MPKFEWKGTNSQGKLVNGTIEAKEAKDVFNYLKKQGIKTEVSQIKNLNAGLNMELKIPGFAKKVQPKDVVIFTRQFATMIDAGLPLVKGIEIIGESNANPAFKKSLRIVRENVETGMTLAEAMSKQPKTFDELYTNMVRAGENGGILDIIMERLAIQLEKTMKLKREVKTAMIYPGVVISAAIIVTSVLLIFVIPTFAEMFQGFGSELPVPTQIVINLSNFFVANWYIIFGLLGGTIFAFIKTLKTDRGKEIFHPVFLKLPVFGDIIRKVAVARFTRTLSTMLGSGVPILDAMAICAKTSGNKVVENDIFHARAAISEGKSIIEPLQESDVFPPMVVSMIEVGESSGALDAMLTKIADFYEDEVDNAVGAMKQLIEPLMILFLGIIIGGLVIAMYLPIFKMGSIV